jgi:hypothetical protein
MEISPVALLSLLVMMVDMRWLKNIKVCVLTHETNSVKIH